MLNKMYIEKSVHQQQTNIQHRSYEYDLERDHALPTSAPNADILKSNSNPTYPNPNKYHNHDRDRQRHAPHSTPLPTLPNILKKNIDNLPTVPMYPGDIPSYSPPVRSFFTPPLPPEYQNPFADKPTLRGTNSDGIITNMGAYMNRRPIPPPSLMPGRERIPYRPPESYGGGVYSRDESDIVLSTTDNSRVYDSHFGIPTDPKKALNTPSRINGDYVNTNLRITNAKGAVHTSSNNESTNLDQKKALESRTLSSDYPHKHNNVQEIFPSIQRILSGSNGNIGEIPKVLLKQVTSQPAPSHNTSSSPEVFLDSIYSENGEESAILASPNINKSKTSSKPFLQKYDAVKSESNESKYTGKSKTYNEHPYGIITDESRIYSSTSTLQTELELEVLTNANLTGVATMAINNSVSSTPSSINSGRGTGSSKSTPTAAAVSHSTWTVAWNIHVYLSVVLFTMLAVYSLYKVLTYNKLTHIFSQSYFMCIHVMLVFICSLRIFYLCYDAYNIHSTFNFFISELLLNLPATFLTISFSVLILHLFLKALNHKNNRYSTLLRPLTVAVGCGVQVILCITLHYVESYTMQNHQLQHLWHQQQLYRRQQQYKQLNQLYQHEYIAVATPSFLATATVGMSFVNTPPRVLSLLCQIIYIFVCLFLGILYLYLYRILKQMLRTKSQNYIHGYQNVFYAIHITIATALLFVLLAILQIVGAISISASRPIVQQLNAEVDWLQWGYQFSLRLIEIAIIILLSWVTSLEMTGGSGIASANTSVSNGDSQYTVPTETRGDGALFFGRPTTSNGEKNAQYKFQHNKANTKGYILQRIHNTSQDQFGSNYPTTFNANTNPHMYTIRTGKLTYDDAFALRSLCVNGHNKLTSIENSMVPPSTGSTRSVGEFQLRENQPTYQRTHDSGSLKGTKNSHKAIEYDVQNALGDSMRYGHGVHYRDCFPEASIDHYENPNFDLRGSVGCSGIRSILATPRGVSKLTKTSTNSTTSSSTGGSPTSAVSPQQILLQSDGCHSEPHYPMHTSSNDLESSLSSGDERKRDGNSKDSWLQTGSAVPWHLDSPKSQNKPFPSLECNAYENSERRSTNSTYSAASNTSRYGGYNSFDQCLYSGLKKTVGPKNITGGVISALTNAKDQSISEALTLDLTYEQQRKEHCTSSSYKKSLPNERIRDNYDLYTCNHMNPECNATDTHNLPYRQQCTNGQLGTNVECSNLIGNEDGSCITNGVSMTTVSSSHSQINESETDIDTRPADHFYSKKCFTNDTHSKTFKFLEGLHNKTIKGGSTSKKLENEGLALNLNTSLGPSEPSASISSTSNSSGTSLLANESVNNDIDYTAMVKPEQGVVQFRPIEDTNNPLSINFHKALRN